MDDEDGTCLLDVLCDPQALNDFLHGTTKLQGQLASISPENGSQAQPSTGCVDLSFLEDGILDSPAGSSLQQNQEEPCDILQQSLQEANITEQTLEEEAVLATSTLQAQQYPAAQSVEPSENALHFLAPGSRTELGGLTQQPAVFTQQQLPLSAQFMNKTINLQPLLQQVGFNSLAIQQLASERPGGATSIGSIQVVDSSQAPVMSLGQNAQQLIAKTGQPSSVNALPTGRFIATSASDQQVTMNSTSISSPSPSIFIQKSGPASGVNASMVFTNGSVAQPLRPPFSSQVIQSPVSTQNVTVQKTPTPIQPKPSINIQPKLVQISPKPSFNPNSAALQTALKIQSEAALQHQKAQQNMTFVAGNPASNVLLSAQGSGGPASINANPLKQQQMPPNMAKPVSVQVLNQGGSIVFQPQSVPQAVFPGQNQFILPGQLANTSTMTVAQQLSALPGGSIFTAQGAAQQHLPGQPGTPHVMARQSASGQLITANQALPAQILAAPNVTSQLIAGQPNFGQVFAAPNAQLAVSQGTILSAPLQLPTGQMGSPAVFQMPAQIASAFAPQSQSSAPPALGTNSVATSGQTLIQGVPLPNQITVLNSAGVLGQAVQLQQATSISQASVAPPQQPMTEAASAVLGSGQPPVLVVRQAPTSPKCQPKVSALAQTPLKGGVDAHPLAQLQAPLQLISGGTEEKEKLVNDQQRVETALTGDQILHIQQPQAQDQILLQPASQILPQPQVTLQLQASPRQQAQASLQSSEATHRKAAALQAEGQQGAPLTLANQGSFAAPPPSQQPKLSTIQQLQKKILKSKQMAAAAAGQPASTRAPVSSQAQQPPPVSGTVQSGAGPTQLQLAVGVRVAEPQATPRQQKPQLASLLQQATLPLKPSLENSSPPVTRDGNVLAVGVAGAPSLPTQGSLPGVHLNTLLPSQLQPSIQASPGMIGSIPRFDTALGKGPIQIQVVGNGIACITSAGNLRPALFQEQTLKQPSLFQHKGDLLLEQFCRDQDTILQSDYRSPFASFKDAVSRVLPYHVCMGTLPSYEDFRKVDEEFEVVSTQLLKRTQAMLNKYRLLLLEEARRSSPSAEMVMIDRVFVQEEKAALTEDRKLVRRNPDAYISSVYKSTNTNTNTLTSPCAVLGPPSASIFSHNSSPLSVTKSKVGQVRTSPSVPTAGCSPSDNMEATPLPSRPRPLKTYTATSRGLLKLKIKNEAGCSKVVHNTALDQQDRLSSELGPVGKPTASPGMLSLQLRNGTVDLKAQGTVESQQPDHADRREATETKGFEAGPQGFSGGGAKSSSAAYLPSLVDQKQMATLHSSGNVGHQKETNPGSNPKALALSVNGRTPGLAAAGETWGKEISESLQSRLLPDVKVEDGAISLMKELKEVEDGFSCSLMKVEAAEEVPDLHWELPLPQPKRRKSDPLEVDSASFSSGSPQDRALSEHLQNAINSILDLQRLQSSSSEARASSGGSNLSDPAELDIPHFSPVASSEDFTVESRQPSLVAAGASTLEEAVNSILEEQL
nr:PREDICTED: glioma tumor suppressor candidate region gene 1 protein-like [Latimeria chalumnae]|eukprot:XP_014346580.1 PREDICTED: glioma tumor suppressor candidate region gene 1 protein-like [Latimeria chalumnae]